MCGISLVMNYIPYNNMSVQWRADREGFQLFLPWVSLDIDVLPDEKAWVEEAIDSLHSNPYHPTVQKFLEQLKDYTVAYVASRKKEEFGVVGDVTFKEISNQQQFKSPHTLAQSLDQDAYQEIQEALPPQWEWPIEEVLRVSKIAGSNLYDPLTIVTYLVGQRLASESFSEELRKELPQKLDRLRIKDEDRFFEVMKTLIRQTHYITNTFEKCMSLSLDSFQQARELIIGFIEEEKGHDRLMEASLRELGCNNPNLLKPFATTTLVMNIFKWAASYSPLAFTLLIGYFEGADYQDTDPLAEVLKVSSKPKAARGYALHHEINKNEQHNTMITELANYLEPQSENQIICAAHILELAVILGEMGDNILISLIK